VQKSGQSSETMQNDTPDNPVHPPRLPNPSLLSSLISSYLDGEDLSREAKAAGLVPGAGTGFKQLDDELGGYLAPGVHTLLAAPGAGKTSLSLQIAARCGCPALYVTAEMPRIELLRRLIARETGTFLGRLRGGGTSRESLQKLAECTAQNVPQLALLDAHEAAVNPGDTGNGATCLSIAARGQALRERFNTPNLLIIIDSVTEWAPLATMNEPSLSGSSEYSQAEAAVNGLRNLATVLNCAVIAIAHRHRAGQGKDADRLHAAKGTGRYEYISESVWDLNRDFKVPADRDGRVPAELVILKNRHGATGTTIPLLFEGRLQKFIPKF
jgi:replicative DNA helicase